MISLSYKVRVWLKPDHTIEPFSEPPSNFDALLSMPEAAYGLSLEELDQYVVTPFKNRQDIHFRQSWISNKKIPFIAIERIEIRAVGTDTLVPNSLRVYLAEGTDVSSEFIKGPMPCGPIIGAHERPESIPVDQLFDRLVTNECLRQATRNRFRSRNFPDAVEAAFKCLDNAVKERSGHHERNGADLMRHVLSDKSPILKLNPLQSRSDISEQKGYMDIFAGVMTGIRNPRAHEDEIKDNPAVAIELLAFANHLMRKLESATKD